MSALDVTFAINPRLFQLTVNSGQRTTVNCQLSIVNCQLFTVDIQQICQFCRQYFD
jgi:hypothetical protein